MLCAHLRVQILLSVYASKNRSGREGILKCSGFVLKATISNNVAVAEFEHSEIIRP